MPRTTSPRKSPTTGIETRHTRICLCQLGKSGSLLPVTGLVPISPWKPGRGSWNCSVSVSVPQVYDRAALRLFHSSMNTVDQIMLNTACTMWALTNRWSSSASKKPGSEVELSVLGPSGGRGPGRKKVMKTPRTAGGTRAHV